MNLFYLILAMLPPVGPEEPPKGPPKDPPPEQHIYYRLGPFYFGEDNDIEISAEEVYREDYRCPDGCCDETGAIYRIERLVESKSGIRFWVYMGQVSEITVYSGPGGWTVTEKFYWSYKGRYGCGESIQQAIQGMLGLPITHKPYKVYINPRNVYSN